MCKIQFIGPRGKKNVKSHAASVCAVLQLLVYSPGQLCSHVNVCEPALALESLTAPAPAPAPLTLPLPTHTHTTMSIQRQIAVNANANQKVAYRNAKPNALKNQTVQWKMMQVPSYYMQYDVFTL